MAKRKKQVTADPTPTIEATVVVPWQCANCGNDEFRVVGAGVTTNERGRTADGTRYERVDRELRQCIECGVRRMTPVFIPPVAV